MDTTRTNGPMIALISLGCPKNLVNSEEMLALLDDAGYCFTDEPAEAQVVIINTCGFIDDAKSEAIDRILETAALREENPELKIVVTGCLSQRYGEEIRAEIPEVDALVGTGSYGEIVSVVDEVLQGAHPVRMASINAPLCELPRVISTGPSWAYLRIAEGCDNRCAYCIIPTLRGKFRSRTMESILEEARGLSESGIREVIIVAQDITRYGIDLYGRHRLADLLRELCKMNFNWVRLHYLYPEEIDDELIEVIASEPKIVKYLDIPIQHINTAILKRMNRRGTGEEIRALFAKLRARIPELVLRTSLIVGLPGEGEAEFEELCEFLREARIERAGVFPFSPEEGTPAARMDDRCTREEAQRRAGLIMDLQAVIMDELAESFIDQEIDVLVMGRDDMGLLWGRSAYDSPEIDSRVVFGGMAEPGDMVRVLITGADDGELIGQQV